MQKSGFIKTKNTKIKAIILINENENVRLHTKILIFFLPVRANIVSSNEKTSVIKPILFLFNFIFCEILLRLYNLFIVVKKTLEISKLRNIARNDIILINKKITNNNNVSGLRFITKLMSIRALKGGKKIYVIEEYMK